MAEVDVAQGGNEGTDSVALGAGYSTELLELTEAEVDLTSLYLDPNNPRLVVDPVGSGQLKEDGVAVQPAVQANLQRILEETSDVAPLADGMCHVGFVLIDSVVVRPCDALDGAYIVLEGNRRIAAAKSVLADAVRFHSLPEAIRESFSPIRVMVYSGDDPKAAWRLQGFRNSGAGLKDWGSFQKASYIFDMVVNDKLSITAVKEITSYTAGEIEKYIRSYYGYLAAQKDPEFGPAIAPKDFSVFHEGVFDRLRKNPFIPWLKWSDATHTFGEEDNLNDLLRLMKEKDDATGKPRIERVNPDLRDRFSVLLKPGNELLLSDFVDGKMTLDAAHELARAPQPDPQTANLDGLLAELSEIEQRLRGLPVVQVRHEKRVNEFVSSTQGVQAAASEVIDDLSK